MRFWGRLCPGVLGDDRDDGRYRFEDDSDYDGRHGPTSAASATAYPEVTVKTSKIDFDEKPFRTNTFEEVRAVTDTA